MPRLFGSKGSQAPSGGDSHTGSTSGHEQLERRKAGTSSQTSLQVTAAAFDQEFNTKIAKYFNPQVSFIEPVAYALTDASNFVECSR